MSDAESVKKMLRSVLQCNKNGVSMGNLQSEYRALCGESIPLKELGFSRLEDYLRSIPSVVRLEYRMGEVNCFAGVCKETAHIAELVAKQRNSKKSGRSQLVNCRMRFKPSNPYMLNVRPRASLRQPSAGGRPNRSQSHGSFRGFSATGDYRQLDQMLSTITPVEHRQPAGQQAVKQCVVPHRDTKDAPNVQRPKAKRPDNVPRPNQSSLYSVELVQSRIIKLLQKYSQGLWMSKVSSVYNEMFSQKLHPQVLIDIEEWTDICMVEKSSSVCRADCLIYPPLPPKLSTTHNITTTNTPPSPTSSGGITTPISSRPPTPEQQPPPKPKVSPQSPLAKPTFIFPPQPAAPSADKLLSSVTPCTPHQNHQFAGFAVSPGGKDNLNLPKTVPKKKKNNNSIKLQSTDAPPLTSSLQPGPDILPLLKVTFPTSSDSASCPPPKSAAAAAGSAEVRERIKELLSKCSQGLWAYALPKLYMDTYKTPVPEHILDDLSLLLDICTVEYPNAHDRKKAILYNVSRADMETTDGHESQQRRSHPLPSGLQVLGPVVPPTLVLPSDQYPSVLITNAKSSSAVTIRYVGENYSNAQEAMEDVMLSFYSQGCTHPPLSNPAVGQLVAVKGEDGEELARGQVIEVMASNKVKVYYVDHGFSVETSGTNVLELHPDFLSLPFQAINVRLAGLEAFSSHPLVLSSLDKLGVGKILLMETLQPCQPNETPLAVLYDTSQDDDININSTCLKALQDETMNNPLTVNATYQDVCVTNVCADGIIYCQLPSRGTARLTKLLEQTEVIFTSQMTSDFLVSRPFIGKFCLARYKGRWSRAEITNMYGNRVMEIHFIDLGVPATVEVTDLREIPLLLLKDLTIIPPQTTKCCLADITVPEGDWSPEAVLWLKDALQGSEDCKIKILKLDQHKGDRLVHVYLLVDADSQELDKSFNQQLAQSELWQTLTTHNNNTITSKSSRDPGLRVRGKFNLSSLLPNPVVKASNRPPHKVEDSCFPDTQTQKPLPLPPLLELPQPGQNMDVFVPVACHPGYFVLQPWQDRHKLVVLMGEMILYYNQAWKTSQASHIQKGEVYAAKIDKKWHRVQVKGILANGFVSVFELDHGKHELVRSTLLWPLIEEFRQLPFQAITAQLAGVTQHHWSEEASMLFRNHVEDRALVAQVESVQEVMDGKGELWERRLTVYLVDTTSDDRDVWIHSMMADISDNLSSAA